ncbi:MAG: YigZ family protein [Traorella sp.]
MPRIKNEVINEIVIEKSRFITYLNRAECEEDAKNYIQFIKKMHPDATHHCSAFIYGNHSEYQKSSDDGEPSGTAGVPMLECLRKNQMQDIVCVVVRYFGGIKLGAGGLIRAYSKSVSCALNEAVLVEVKEMKEYTCTFSYDLIGVIDYFFSKHHILILDKKYDEEVTYNYVSEKSMEKELMELSKGKIKHSYIEDLMIEVDM